MVRIGLLSDTHGYWDEKYLKYFENCDEIWHVGDIGSMEVAEKLAAFRSLRAVYGNIDGQDIRKAYPQINRFTIEGAEVLIKHIGGYPGNYDPSIRGSILVRPPKLFHQRAFTYIEGDIRQENQLFAHESRCCWQPWLSCCENIASIYN